MIEAKVVEVRAGVTALDEGEWLRRLLADVHAEIARHPSPRAVARIRERLLAAIERPERAAA